jgi:hypothetical protein
MLAGEGTNYSSWDTNHCEGLVDIPSAHNLYSSQRNAIRMTGSRRMKQVERVEHVESVEENPMHIEFWVDNPTRK